MPDTAELVFLATSLVLLAFALGCGARNVRRHGDWTLVLCVVGGMAASLLEPVVDILGLMYLPERDAMQAFEFFDRAMPVFVVTSYGGYIGGLAYVALRRFEAGITVRGAFELWAILALTNVAFETPAVLLDVYTYYGKQPLNLWGFPLWWGFVNPLTGMVAGAVILHLRPLLTGARALLIVPVVFAADGVANGAAATPMWLTLNDDGLAHAWTWLACAITLALVLMVVRIIALAVCRTPNAGTATG